MFGHVDHYRHWARHLLRLRELQTRTGGLYRIRAAAVRADGDANSFARRAGSARPIAKRC